MWLMKPVWSVNLLRYRLMQIKTMRPNQALK